MQINGAWAMRFAVLLALLVFSASAQTTDSSSAWPQTESEAPQFAERFAAYQAAAKGQSGAASRYG
jgi:hypothetical protein